jgi:proteasome lid subunit RPN8/RPN11
MRAKEIPLSLSDQDVKNLRVMAIQGYPLEVCGAIYSHNIIVQHRNVHPDPEHNYDAEIDIEDVKAIWHSHPQGPITPSDTDIAFMECCVRHGIHIRHIIVTAKEVHEYEVQSDAASSAA